MYWYLLLVGLVVASRCQLNLVLLFNFGDGCGVCFMFTLVWSRLLRVEILEGVEVRFTERLQYGWRQSAVLARDRETDMATPIPLLFLAVLVRFAAFHSFTRGTSSDALTRTAHDSTRT